MKRLLIVLAVMVALALPASASATVHLVKVTSPARKGNHATLAVRVSPRATCSIKVVYKSGPSVAWGLHAKRPNAAGLVTWTWTVGLNTTPGRWSITITCGRAGSLHTSFLVL